MENNNQESHEKKNSIPSAIIIAGAMIAGAVFIRDGGMAHETPQAEDTQSAVREEMSEASFTLPFRWGNIGQKLVSVGVLDRERFLALYNGVERETARRFIDENQEKPIEVTEENAGIWLNLLWGVGLGNKSEILEHGAMTDPRYGGAERFASTGGWTIAEENPMNHYSRHPFAALTAEQENLVARVVKGIYRPCCDNSTYFPDCNHGMAMLGLLELMATSGASESEMYEAGLTMNRLWFPSQYEVIDRYVAAQTIENVSAKTLLSADFASASGFQKIARALETAPAPRQEGGGCSV